MEAKKKIKRHIGYSLDTDVSSLYIYISLLKSFVFLCPFLTTQGAETKKKKKRVPCLVS